MAANPIPPAGEWAKQEGLPVLVINGGSYEMYVRISTAGRGATFAIANAVASHILTCVLDAERLRAALVSIAEGVKGLADAAREAGRTDLADLLGTYAEEAEDALHPQQGEEPNG